MTARVMTASAFGLLVGSLCAIQASAEPCVGAGFDRPFPGARNVVTRFVDVPSPRFPGLWQEGSISGYAYFIYANGEATIQAEGEDPSWAISVQCEADAGSCSQTQIGTPPEAAQRLSVQISRCFTAPDTVVTEAPSETEQDTTAPPTEGWALTPPAQPPLVAVGAPEDERQAPPAPCGLATIAEGATGITLQRLLVAAGADPGPIDGMPGRRTRDALIQILGGDAAELEPDAAASALDAFLCEAPG